MSQQETSWIRIEGVDFSYLENTPGGGHVRWECDAPIEVVIAGPAEAATRVQVSAALRDVIGASGLPMVLSGNLPTFVTGPSHRRTDEITISFLNTAQIAATHLDMDQDTLGRTDTRSDGSAIDADGTPAIGPGYVRVGPGGVWVQLAA